MTIRTLHSDGSVTDGAPHHVAPERLKPRDKDGPNVRGVGHAQRLPSIVENLALCVADTLADGDAHTVAFNIRALVLRHPQLARVLGVRQLSTRPPPPPDTTSHSPWSSRA